MSLLDALFSDPIIGALKSVTITRDNAPFDVNAIVEYKDRAILDERGDTVQSRAKLITQAEIRAGDIVTLDSRDLYVLRVDRPMLEGSPSHSEAYL